MSHQPQMNMPGMGGPVGGGGGALAGQMNMGTPNSLDMSPQIIIKKLNTAIYDYLLRNELYDIAKLVKDKMPIETKTDMKQSPDQRNGMQANGADDGMDDSKDIGLSKRPDGLPLPNNLFDGPFLQDWWCQFWEIWHGHRKKGANNGTQMYIGAQRQAQKGRFSMMGADPNLRYNNMMQMNNGMAMPADLKRTAMQQNQQVRNNMTPQQMAQIKNMQQNAQMMQGNQMERQGSQMDMSGPRSGSPTGDAPSPKRQRLEGGMPQMNQGRPGQPGQMQGNQSVEVYSQSIQQQMQAAMNSAKSNVNKGMNPNAGPGGAQGSPMSQPGMDTTGEFYAANGRMAMPPNGAAGAQGGNGNNGNHALQDYQMQLMLLEQQNKKRLLMARQEQDSMHPGAGGGGGPNGQFAPGMSPQGSQRSGDPSPNLNDAQRGRGSPTPGMMDPNQVPPNVRAQMVVGPNGQLMRPPSSHPMAGMTPQQMEIMRQQNVAMPNGQFPPGQLSQGQMMPGQQGVPGGQQGLPMGTPRQNTNMPPPPAPQANAGGTQPSSPSQQPAPPTPSQASKAKPATKKEAAKKGAANKKGSIAGATPATESEAPPTPTPLTPATPMNPNSFAHKQNQQLPNGQPAPNAQANAQGANNSQQQSQNPQQQQQVATNNPQQTAPTAPIDMSFGSLDNGQFEGLNLDFQIGGDELENFDFDSFLNADGGEGLGFDANFAFDGLEATGLDGN